MAVYRGSVIHAQQLVCFRKVEEVSRVTSFFICRTTCLWEVVGYFLGCLVPSPEARPAWAEGSRRHGASLVAPNHFK